MHAKLGEIERVDDDVEHLVCTLSGIADFARLSRFTKLRKLAILPLRPPGKPASDEAAERFYWSWRLADNTALGHLLQMERLEHLHLPDVLSLRPDVLGPLRRLPGSACSPSPGPTPHRRASSPRPSRLCPTCASWSCRPSP